MSLKGNEIETLFQLLSLPTAPFREDAILEFCEEYLQSRKIPFFKDSIGNLVIGQSSYKNYLKNLKKPTLEPFIMLIAHTDHPGFLGAKWLGSSTLQIDWHGGSPTKFLSGTPMWIAEQGFFKKYPAKMQKATLHKHGHSIKNAQLKILEPWWTSLKDRPKATSLFGAFRFRSSVWKNKTTLYTGGADDIVGVFSVLKTAENLWKQKVPARKTFLGLLSRAEEVGFIGSIGHFEKVLPKASQSKIVILSLETSRTLPNALIGSGPVVRLGDRSSVFDSSLTALLHDCAEKKLAKKYQRRIMDGGTCEATAAICYGFASAGVSVPLGNYHNISYQGGPDSRGNLGAAPEFVDIRDIAGQVTLCEEFVKRPLKNRTKVFESKRKRFAKMLKDAQKLLHEK